MCVEGGWKEIESCCQVSTTFLAIVLEGNGLGGKLVKCLWAFCEAGDWEEVGNFKQ